MSEILKPTDDIFPELKEIPGILRIGVDIDGVVADIRKPVAGLILEKYGIDVLAIWNQGPTNYQLQEWPEIKSIPGAPEFVRELIDGVQIYQQALPIPGAIETLNLWKTQGYEIWFISARSKTRHEVATKKWFSENNLGWAINRILLYDSFNGEKNYFKTQASARFSPHIFIEDHAETVRGISSPSMMAKLVIKYSWNMAEDIGSQSVLVKDWSEINAVVQEASRWHYQVVSHNIDTERSRSVHYD